MEHNTEHFDRLVHAAGLHQAGNLKEAEQLYREMIGENENDANALHLLGILTHQTGNSRSGAQLVAQAMSIAPDVPMFHNNYGEIMLSMNQLEQAQEHLLKATQQDPEKNQPLYNLGECYRRMGQMEEAGNCLQMVLERDSTHIHAWLSLGRMHMDNKQPDIAQEYIEMAHSIEADNLEVRLQLARARFAQGDYPDTVELLSDIIDQDPGNTPACNNLGNAFMELKQFDRAVEAYRKALERSSKDPGMQYNLALALIESGQPDISLEHLELARQLAPDNKQLEKLLGDARQRAIAAG